MTVEQIIENNKKTVEAIKSYHQTKYPYTFAICRAMGDDNDNCKHGLSFMRTLQGGR